MDSELDVSLFEEPEGFRPPSPPPFNPEPQSYALKDGRQLSLQLVSASPLWGHVLYPSSICMARYLEEHPKLVRGQRVLELGAGAGLPGLVAGSLEAEQVLITDYPDANLVTNLEHNVQVNHLGTNCQAKGFVWGTAVQPLLEPLTDSTRPKAFDVLLLADLVFNHSQHDALLRTCEEVIAQQGSDSAGQASEPVALCFYAHHRPTAELIRRDESFLRNAEARGWDVKLVVENQNAGLAFPEDKGDAAVRATVKGWEMRWKGGSHKEQ